MRDLIRITKALADPGRVRMVHALKRGELCVCQITELFGLAPSTVSKMGPPVSGCRTSFASTVSVYFRVSIRSDTSRM